MNTQREITIRICLWLIIILSLTLSPNTRVLAISVDPPYSLDTSPPTNPNVQDDNTGGDYPEIQLGEGFIIVHDITDPDCHPDSDETPAVLNGNLFGLQEGHHYCRLERNGDSECFHWDGQTFTSSLPPYDMCANVEESWCHIFTDADTHPCTDLTLSYQGELICTSPESISASGQVPCMIVQRWPYPRGLVNPENEFTVLGPWVSERGRAFSAEWDHGRFRNYLLEVEWRFNEGSYPVWFFDEREWNDEPNYTSGFTATHTYQTSSWAKPENGPSLNGRLELPAYQAQVHVQWIAYVHRRFEFPVEIRKGFSCSAADYSCLEQKSQCEATGYEQSDPDCHTTEWRVYDSGWVPIDLRDYGSGFPWYTSGAAIDISLPPGDIPPVPDPARNCGPISVPVIEVQVYLNAP